MHNNPIDAVPRGNGLWSFSVPAVTRGREVALVIGGRCDAPESIFELRFER